MDGGKEVTIKEEVRKNIKYNLRKMFTYVLHPNSGPIWIISLPDLSIHNYFNGFSLYFMFVN